MYSGSRDTRHKDTRQNDIRHKNTKLINKNTTLNIMTEIRHDRKLRPLMGLERDVSVPVLPDPFLTGW